MDLFVIRAGLAELMNNHFWSDGARAQWPVDDDGYVFFGRAVLRLGRARHDAGWRDDAASFPLPAGAPATPFQQENPIEYFLDARQYERDVLATRSREIVDQLVAAARNGDIVMASSPHRRREYTSIPRSWWVEGNWDHLLHRAEISRHAPQNPYSTRDSQLLFIAKAGLETLVQGTSAPPERPRQRTGREKGGRPNILPTVLSIYRDRLKTRSCIKMKKAEANAIVLAWHGDVACPASGTVQKRLTDFHSGLHFVNDRLSDESAESVLALVEAELAKGAN